MEIPVPPSLPPGELVAETVGRFTQKAFISRRGNVTQIHKCFKTDLAQFGVSE